MVQNRDIILDVIEVLMKRETHLRELSRIMNESHSTISRKLSLLQIENVIDHKTEGKNKIYFLKKNMISRNYVIQSEYNKLTKLMIKYPELAIIFREIIEKTNEEMIILFGSYAKGIETKKSDIDIYVETKNKNLKKIVEDIYSKINVKIGDFAQESPLIKEIIKNHIIIRGAERLHERTGFLPKTDTTKENQYS